MAQRKTQRGARRQQPARAQAADWQQRMRQATVILLLSLLVAGWVYLQQEDTLPVRHVTVEGGLQHTSRDDLVESVTPFVTGSFLDVNVAGIRDAGEKLAWVREIQVRRVWPDTLHLIVEEHEAVARWNNKGLVSNRGQVFFPGELQAFQQLVLLQGPPDTSRLMTGKLASVQKAVAVLGLQVRKLDMDARRSWNVEFADGLQLRLGRAESDKRLARFVSVFASKLAPYQPQMAIVDMRYTNGLAVKWKDDEQPDFNGTV